MFYGLGYVLTQWMFHGFLGKNMYSAAVWWSLLYILTRCCWLIALFISFVPLLIFCLAVLSVAKSRLGRLRIVDLCVSPLSSIWFCFLYLFKDFFFFFFGCDLLLKTLFILLQHCFCFYVFVFWPWGMLDLSSLTRDRTCTPCTGRQCPNHWTTRELPAYYISKLCFSLPTQDHYVFLVG